MPCNYKRDYPPNWRTEIRPRILDRDGHKCKKCGLPNGVWGYRDEHGQFIQLDPASTTADVAVVDGYKVIQIQLGIAHLDHGLTNHDDANLAALCRRCHLRYDLPVSAPKAASSRKYGRKRDQHHQSLFDQEDV